MAPENNAQHNRYRTLPTSEASDNTPSRPPPGDPTVRRIITDARRLTGGSSVRDPDRAILAACSGGADSSALVLALAAGKLPVTVAHIRHDLRLIEDAAHDEDHARRLAAHLGLPFVRADVHVRALAGNAEANARHARERSLVQIAQDHGIRHIATGHHADDQLETLLFRLTRGSGLAGLRAILEDRPARRSPGSDADVCRPTPRLIRPMLRVTHAQARSLCHASNWSWAEDHTNADTTRARAALRHSVLPALRDADPSAALRAGEAAAHLAQAHDYIAQVASDVFESAHHNGKTRRWSRQSLRSTHPAVLSEWIRIALIHGADRVPTSERRRLVNAIRDDRGGTRRFNWPGINIAVLGDRVEWTTAALESIADTAASSPVSCDAQPPSEPA